MSNRTELGSGAYGKVFAYAKAALKLIPIGKSGDTNLQSFIRELDVLRHSNSYIVEFFKCDWRYGSVELHMERMDTDILKYLKNQAFENKDIYAIMEDISHGLHFLHSHCIAHRDIKPSNILLKRTNKGLRAKLCDFGLSRKFSNELHRGSDYMVTRWYRAPEVINLSESYGFGIDMWAFGCVVYEMALRRPLFMIEHASKLEKDLERLSVRINRIKDKRIKNVVTNLVKKDPKHRWSSKQAVAEICQVPSPVYSKAYYVGSTISNLIAKDWFDSILEEHGEDHRRAIMHGLMLFNGSENQSYFDFQCSVYVGYILYESMNDDADFVNYIWSGEEPNCKMIASWVCKNCTGHHMLSQYEYSKDASDVMNSVFQEEHVRKKRKR